MPKVGPELTTFWILPSALTITSTGSQNGSNFKSILNQSLLYSRTDKPALPNLGVMQMPRFQFLSFPLKVWSLQGQSITEVGLKPDD